MKRCLGIVVASSLLALALGVAHAQSTPATCGMLGGDLVVSVNADADLYTAGAGNDFLYNDDGVAETVNCGGGNADDAEVDTGATDTFIGCEL